MRARAHQALQRLSGERDHHRLKGRERTWMETRVWYHGNAKHRVLKEDRERRTALQRKNEMLRMKMERKKAYDKWVKSRSSPTRLEQGWRDGERVQRLRDPAPRKTQRDRARARRPRRKKDREGFDAGESPAPEPYIRQPEPGTSVSDRGGYMPRFGGKSSSSVPKAPTAARESGAVEGSGNRRTRGRSISPIESELHSSSSSSNSSSSSSDNNPLMVFRILKTFPNEQSSWLRAPESCGGWESWCPPQPERSRMTL